MTLTMKKFRTAAVCLLIAVIASACGAAAPAEPTQDPNAVFTQVAETVMVSMTQTAEAMPPTPMPEPTATVKPTKEPKPTDTAATAPVAPTQPIGPTATIPRVGDSAMWASNNPADGKIFKPGVDFQITACFINNGTTEWDNTYYLEWIDGYRLWNDTKYFYVVDKTEPGGKWCFTMPAVSPHEAGDYTTYWNFYNPEGYYMEQLYFAYKVEP